MGQARLVLNSVVRLKIRKQMNKFSVLILQVILIFGGCLGGSNNAVFYVEADDEKMNAAIAHARETVNDFIERFQNPKSTNSDFSVKVKIEDGDKVEHFWLSDISYSNGTFSGTIGNDPVFVKNVKFGQQIRVKSDQITDWMYLDDGKMRGNFTLRVLLERMPEEQAKAIREQFKMDH